MSRENKDFSWLLVIQEVADTKVDNLSELHRLIKSLKKKFFIKKRDVI